MSHDDHKWFYKPHPQGNWIGPESWHALSKHALDPTTVVTTEPADRTDKRAVGLPIGSLIRIPIEFDPPVTRFSNTRNDHATTVLSGPNNCGKSLLLKWLRANLLDNACYLGASRFYMNDGSDNFVHRQMRAERERADFIRQLIEGDKNDDNSYFDLDDLLTGLNDDQRTVLFSLCENLLSYEFGLYPLNRTNSMTPLRVHIGNDLINSGSSGTRLLLMLFAACLAPKFDTVFIDEPEIGLAPKLQVAVSRLLYEPASRARLFPHLKSLYVATHSHLFLDRNSLQNNFVLARDQLSVRIQQVQDITDFHRLQFSLLGNDLESMWMPSAIILTEGASDVEFLMRVFQLREPSRNVAIVDLQGAGNSNNRLQAISTAFGSFAKSPYRDRTFVLLDKEQSVKVTGLTNQGVDENNIVIWTQNGIEHYYPTAIMARIFHCDERDVSKIDIGKNYVTYHDIRKKKTDLAKEVMWSLRADSRFNAEFESMLAKVHASLT